MKFCSSCGHPLDSSSAKKFCANCGKSLRGVEVVAAKAPPSNLDDVEFQQWRQRKREKRRNTIFAIGCAIVTLMVLGAISNSGSSTPRKITTTTTTTLATTRATNPPASTTTQTTVPETTESAESFKNSCELVKYDPLMRNSLDYYYQKIKFTGESCK